MKFRLGSERKNKLVTFSNIVPDLMEELNIEDSFIVEEVKARWISYVGSILASHSYPEKIFNRTLFINVDHSVYASDLSIHSNEILKKIKYDYGDSFIKSIKFKVKKSRWRTSE